MRTRRKKTNDYGCCYNALIRSVRHAWVCRSSNVCLHIHCSYRLHTTTRSSREEIGVHLAQSIPKRDLRTPAQLCELRDIQSLSRHSIGACEIEIDFSPVAHHFRNQS